MSLKALINLRLNKPLNALLDQLVFAILHLRRIVAHPSHHAMPCLIHEGHILGYKLLLVWRIAEQCF